MSWFMCDPGLSKDHPDGCKHVGYVWNEISTITTVDVGSDPILVGGHRMAPIPQMFCTSNLHIAIINVNVYYLLKVVYSYILDFFL